MGSMHKKKVLFINLADASFIRLDEKILSSQHQVSTFKFKHKKGWRIIPELIRQFGFVLSRIFSSDIVFIWFADFHAVIPTVLGRLFGKKVIIVVGGYDAAFEKDLNYGVKTRHIGKWSATISLSLASKLLPVTRFTQDDMLRNFNPRLEKKSTLIYNCYNDIFHCPDNSDRKKAVVTICLASSRITVIRKGVDFYVELAQQMPDTIFYVIGVEGDAFDFLSQNLPKNVKLTGKIPQTELRDILCKSKVICQFSRYEAFGIALLEGISSGCYPVGLNYGGTSEILIDGLGLLIDKLDEQAGKKAIEEALIKTPDDIIPIKKSIDERFAFAVRQKKLLKFIDEV